MTIFYGNGHLLLNKHVGFLCYICTVLVENNIIFYLKIILKRQDNFDVVLVTSTNNSFIIVVFIFFSETLIFLRNANNIYIRIVQSNAIKEKLPSNLTSKILSGKIRYVLTLKNQMVNINPLKTIDHSKDYFAFKTSIPSSAS